MAEPGAFDRAKGYIIRGHELIGLLTIIGLAFYSSVVTLGLVWTIQSGSGVRQQAAYNLGNDVGLFCSETQMHKCTIVCRNNYEDEVMLADCLRGVVNGYNSKDEQALWEETVRPDGE